VNWRTWELYFPPMVNVWHVEPHGEDALRGECRGTRWQWHIHHWQIQWCYLQGWRRRLLTKCAWCGGRSTKRDPVNVSHTWDGPKQPLWRGEKGLFHQDCSMVQNAHKLCLCEHPLLSGSKCLWCEKPRTFRPPNAVQRYLATLPVGERIPEADLVKLKAMRQKDGR